ncbi:MAG: cyclase family protein [Abditibacteriota bacterium]|nr:cyclase family protein [Abditibacteriota bacterium]
MKITDLSQRLTPDILVYPGDEGLTMTPTRTMPQTTSLRAGSHIGTHIDAPAHMLEGGRNIDAFPLDAFYGKAWCAAPGTKDGKLPAPPPPPPGCRILVVASFWKRSTRDGKSFLLDFPGFSDELCDYILGHGFSLCATDIPSVDTDPGFHIHKRLLSAGVPIVEGLIIPPELAGKEFVFAAFPLSLPCDSSPVRAVAIEG